MSRALTSRHSSTPSFAKTIIDQAVSEVLRPMRQRLLAGGFVAAGALAAMPLAASEPATQAEVVVSGAPSITISDPSVVEGNAGTANLVYVLTRSGDLSRAATVRYTTGAVSDTATAGTDYVASTGTVEFPAGQATATVSITVNGDTAIEASETVTLTLELASVDNDLVGFAGGQTFQGFNARFMVSGDLNGDGRPDLAATNYSGSVTILLNTTAANAGTASFLESSVSIPGENPVEVILADVNRDSNPDVVVNTGASGRLFVLLNTTPDGSTVPSFAPQATFAIPAGSGLASADINGDFNPDIITTRFNAVSVLLNTTPPGAATPSFAAPATFAASNGTNAVATGDFDSDGRPDLATTSSSGNSVQVFRNTTATGAATPAFRTPDLFFVGTNPQSLVVSDIGRDGRDDIVVANQGSNTISVLVNTFAPGGTISSFAPAQNFAVGTSPRGLSAGDVTGDGSPEIVVANYASNTISVLRNTSMTGSTVASFTALPTIPCSTFPISTAILDANSDGKPDLAASAYGTDQIYVFLNNSPDLPTAFQFSQFSDAGGAAGVATADFDGDGRDDFIVAGGNTSRLFTSTTATGATIASFAPPVTFGHDTSFAVAVGDFNRDGKPDFVLSTATSLNVYLNTTATGATVPSFAAPATFLSFVGTGLLAVADFNRDGADDFAALSSGGNLQFFFNTAPVGGAAAFAPSATTGFGSGTTSFIAVDLNGDGIVDLAAGGGVNQLFLRRNDTPVGSPSPAWGPTQSISVPSGAAFVVAGDFNNDGSPDLLGNFQSLQNTTPVGGATFSFNIGQFTGPGFGARAVGDFNLDGKIDVFCIGSPAGVLINVTPDGANVPSFVYQTVLTGSSPRLPTVGDFNSDGRPDVVVPVSVAESIYLNSVLGISDDIGVGTITTDDLSTVTLSTLSATFTEFGGSTTINATLSAASSADVTVTLEFTGTATLGIDYTASGTSILIPAGSLVGSVTLTAISDTVVEGAETVNVGIASASGATPGGTPVAISLVENAPPVINSATFSPASPFPGDAVTFTVSATDPENNALTIGYNYGDGSSDNTGVHSYSAPGTYTVTVSVSDGVSTVTKTLSVDVLDSGGNGSLGDRDGDGFDDFIENALLTDPNSNKSRPFDLPKPTLADASGLIIKKLSIRIRAGKPKLNSLTLSGSLPASANFTPQGKPIIVSVGGVVRSFVSDKQGFSPIGTAFDKIRFARARGGRVKFDLKLTKGTFTTVAREGGSVRVIVIFENQRFELLVPAK